MGVLLRVCFCLVAVLPQWGQGEPVVLVSGAVTRPLTLTATELGKLPRARAGKYKGVWLHEVLRRAGVPGGKELKGKGMASYVVAKARDGYEVVFSLAELDPVFTDGGVLLADREDGKPLGEKTGPFRFVAGREKLGARSVRMVTEIVVVMLRN